MDPRSTPDNASQPMLQAIAASGAPEPGVGEKGSSAMTPQKSSKKAIDTLLTAFSSWPDLTANGKTIKMNDFATNKQQHRRLPHLQYVAGTHPAAPRGGSRQRCRAPA